MAPELLSSLSSVFLLGVSLGLTACAVTCLPFIGTYVLGKAEGRRSGMIDAGLFLCGRLVAYTGLGALAGSLGAWFVKHLAEGQGNLVIGFATLLSAGLLLAPGKRTHTACGKMQRQALSPLLMGVALTLIPCAPLATLLASAAAGNSIAQGALMGLTFGIGALFTPMLVLIPATASVAKRLCADQPWIATWLRYAAVTVLVAIGLRRIAAADESIAVLALCAMAAGGCLAALRRHVPAREKTSHPVFVVQSKDRSQPKTRLKESSS